MGSLFPKRFRLGPLRSKTVDKTTSSVAKNCLNLTIDGFYFSIIADFSVFLEFLHAFNKFSSSLEKLLLLPLLTG